MRLHREQEGEEAEVVKLTNDMAARDSSHHDGLAGHGHHVDTKHV